MRVLHCFVWGHLGDWFHHLIKIAPIVMNLEAIQKIRWLQTTEGHHPCFKTNQVSCIYRNKCCWAEMCFSEPKIKPLIKFSIVE